MWSLRGQDPRDVLVVQDDLEGLKRYCRQVIPLGTTWSPYAMAYENNKVIALCRGVTPSLARIWPQLKNFR